jgi:ribonuclease D
MVAAWREHTAAASDRPPRLILPDLAVLGIAHKPPADESELRRVRGVEDRHLGRGRARELLKAAAEGESLPPERLRLPPSDDVERDQRPAVALAAAWVGQLARDLGVDAALLGTRADLHALLRHDADARLATGWRAELVGEPLRRLVEGDAALAFDGHGGLVLEARSHRPT